MDAVATTHIAGSARPADEGTSIKGRIRYAPLLFTLLVILALVYGWLGHYANYLSASDGLGYTLGIVGGSAMLLLLLYPLRKHLRFMHRWGPIKYWFRGHMMLGVIGPVLVLYHANFSLGSTISNIALASMLVVAASGVIGRYFYAKIHLGLYGHKASLKELREDLQLTKGRLSDRFHLSAKVLQRLKHFERFVLARRGFLSGFLLLPVIYLNTRFTQLYVVTLLKRSLKRQGRAKQWDTSMTRALQQDATVLLKTYIRTLRKAGELAVYEKLFALWHILHLPLFFILVIAGITHVVAVHMY